MDIDVKDLNQRFRLDMLEKNRSLYLGRVTDDEAETLHKAILWLNALGKEKIVLYMDSGGGETRSGFSIYDGIKNSVAPVEGIVVKRADSMASIILQGCTHRVMYRHATIHVHNIRAQLSVDQVIDGNAKREFNMEEVVKDAQRLERRRQMRQEHMERIFLTRTGLPLEKIQALCSEGTNLSAEEALNLGFIDEVR